ncbi:MAG: Ead/Ea22-like protein [Pseudoduganella sp.]|nr:Ead/Ea22-like protein [Pseudoduganella sp.]
MNITQFNKLRELAQKATPGPWYTQDHYADNGDFSHVGLEANHGEELIGEEVLPSDSDMKFIAAASPAAVLELIALAERAVSPAESTSNTPTWLVEQILLFRGNNVPQDVAAAHRFARTIVARYDAQLAKAREEGYAAGRRNGARDERIVSKAEAEEAAALAARQAPDLSKLTRYVMNAERNIDTHFEGPLVFFDDVQALLAQPLQQEGGKAAAAPIGYLPAYVLQRLAAGDPGVMCTVTRKALPGIGVTEPIFAATPAQASPIDHEVVAAVKPAKLDNGLSPGRYQNFTVNPLPTTPRPPAPKHPPLTGGHRHKAGTTTPAGGQDLPPEWISEVCGPEVDGLSYGQGYRRGFNDCREKVIAAGAALAASQQAAPRSAQRTEVLAIKIDASDVLDAVRALGEGSGQFYDELIEAGWTPPAGSKPRACGGEPANCPENEGHGCACASVAAACEVCAGTGTAFGKACACSKGASHG